MRKNLAMILLSIIVVTTGLAGCKTEVTPRYLNMKWGIQKEVGGFEGLERHPEGIDVELINEDTLKVTWHVRDSYILPLSATAEKELQGVRYQGRGIPAYLEVEWFDPWEWQWHFLEEIPEGKIKVHVEEKDSLLYIDFGPPEGADFEEGMIRVIWFRITPTEPEEFEFEIYGYLPYKSGDPSSKRVSNILTLQAEVRENNR